MPKNSVKKWKLILGLLLLMIGTAMFILGGFIFQVYACAGGALCHPPTNELLMEDIAQISSYLGFLLTILGIVFIWLSRRKKP